MSVVYKKSLEEYTRKLFFKVYITDNAKQQYSDIIKEGTKIFVIYGHCCKTTNKWYIGQTCAIKNLTTRFGSDGNRYLTKNKNNEYNHPKFANALKKYGWEDFDHYILGCYHQDEINDAEIRWIHDKNAYYNGYNSNKGGQNAVSRLPANIKISNALKGHFVSEETRKKISTSLKNSKAYHERVFDPNNLFKSGKDNPMYGKSIPHIGVAKRGKENSFYGKAHTEATKKLISEHAKIRKRSDNEKLIIKKSVAAENEIRHKEKEEHPERFIGNSKPLAMLDANGNILKKFKTATAAAKDVNISRQLITKCANGKSFTAGGHYWKFILAEEYYND